MTQENKKKPLGDRVRGVLDPVLDSEMTHEVMINLVSMYFEHLADLLEPFLEKKMRDLFNAAADKDEAQRMYKIIRGITFVDKDDDGADPIVVVQPIQLPISNAFTNFSASDIKNMPGFIKLHEVARELNVALKFTGLTAEEKKAGHSQTMLYVDLSKDYEAGAQLNPGLYPDLPDRKTTPPSGTFTL